MKKSLLTVGAACLAAVSMLTGCGSIEQQDPGAYLKELNTFMNDAKGLENHKRQAETQIIPNALLSSSRASYVSIAGASLDAIQLRFGSADELYVAKAATDPNFVGEWNALRTSDADKAKAEEAAATLKKVIAEAYASYKTLNKKSVDDLYNSVIGSVAQADYLHYQKLIKSGENSIDDFKDYKTWMELGKKNIQRVFNEEKKVMDARAKKVAEAEKQANADKRKVELILKYHGSKAVIPGVKIGVAEAKKALAGVIPPALAEIGGNILESLLVNVLVEQMEEAKKEWAGVETAISDSFPPFKMPVLDTKGLNPFNFKDKLAGYGNEVKKSIDDYVSKLFAPYQYSLEIGGKRLGFTFKAWAWSYESYKAYKEAAEE